MKQEREPNQNREEKVEIVKPTFIKNFSTTKTN